MVNIVYNFLDIFTIFVPINAILHCLLCLGVNTLYRKTVGRMFCGEEVARKTSKSVSPHSSTLVALELVFLDIFEYNTL
ncbi:G_PROTEIN_RECEP_F1_2 domain-containing protein [Caenorhabditis elegans]|uniref:G_PROTEIN_RECEP_F1_2 domain-containing protein n=1 Tax=Caenorhabditis elegans TaxID=6239 RepID=Q9TZC3_CAEEL|nr:G_PROTEIN_RECEP_F1_2 domain-containing protein [Caenorhabditis elegans]CCD66067.2 G_PROTEIN_RECEP_F1_2 domain-containing protein [Caenorhabditis elegans]